MEKITLSQWSQLLPHGVMVIKEHKSSFKNTPNFREHVLLSSHTIYGCEGKQPKHIVSVKPILYPIDCLTKPITSVNYNDGKEFVPAAEMHQKFSIDFCIANGKFGFLIDEVWKTDVRDWPIRLVNILLSWHINAIGIPEGSFIDKSKI